MWALLLPLAKTTIGSLLEKEEVRRYLISVLRNLADTTDNKLDDQAVDVVEKLLFQAQED